MKLRITLLLLTAVLLIASNPGHSAPLAPALCAANSSSPELPVFNPAALSKSIVLPKCGICSQTICRGANLGSACGVAGNGQIMHCGDTGICSQDGLTSCACTTRAPF